MAVTIVKGSDVTIIVNLKEKETKEPFDLTGFTSASAYFPGDDGEPVIVDAVPNGSEECGRLDVVLDKDTTALLLAGDQSNMEIRIDQGATRTIVQFEGQVDIKEELF